MTESQPDSAVRNVIAQLIADKREVGMQVVAYHKKHKVIDVAMGMTSEAHRDPVTPDTLFSVYSVVKGIAAFCLHILADRKLLDFATPVAHYWPEFGANGKDEITVYDVLTHRAGIPQMPEGVDLEKICDWEWMVGHIAALTPILRPKIDSAYMAMTFGWIVGELIRRIDPRRRRISQFVTEEICRPLGITDLYFSLPTAMLPRYATHSIVPDPLPPHDSLNMKAMPNPVRLGPDVFSRPEILAAEIPAVNGIANARSLARFFAMLANEGELDGVRLISSLHANAILTPRTDGDEYDPVLMRAWRLSTGGFFLATPHKPAVGNGARTVFCMGMGGSLAWADLEKRLAVAITHNLMLNARSADTDPILLVANAVRQGIGLD